MKSVKFTRAFMVSVRNQKEFKAIDEAKGIDSTVDSSRYLLQQAKDLVECVNKWDETKDEAYRIFARTELERILALALRMSIENKWDFFDMLSDGVEYEEEVLNDIREGRRKRDTAKWADASS